MQKNKKFLGRTLLGAAVFFWGAFIFISPASAEGLFDDESENYEDEDYIEIYEDFTWKKEYDSNLSKSIYVYSGATLTLEAGTEITFSKDTRGFETYLSVDGGRLIANGTPEEPVVITADEDNQYRLVEFYGDSDNEFDLGQSILKYTKFFGGGLTWETGCPDCSAFWRKIIPIAYAETRGIGAIYFSSGKARFENCTFYENKYADVEVDYDEFRVGEDNYLQIVDSDFEKFEEAFALKSIVYCVHLGGACQDKILFQNNWYGAPGGPRVDDTWTEGKRMEGIFRLDGWRNERMLSFSTQYDPVIVIPGIMGSTEVRGELKIDPILHTYDNLLASLEKNGYKKDETLFEFPYEWRNSNIISAQELKKKIQDIKKETGAEKVDIIAHSMGGLVARYYIEGNGYQNDVDQLITLGTPQRGSPKSYLSWEAGEGFFGWDGKVAKKIFKLEALHSGYTSLQKYIQEKIVSVRELLPDYDYLFDTEKGKMKKYPTDYPRNSLLNYLNKNSRLEKLEPVNFTSIVGRVSGENTISGFRVVKSQESGSWEHGMPEGFYDKNSDQGMEFGEGDETVPLSSADGIPADKRIEIDSSHGDLPTKAQCEVVRELTGKSDCEYVSTFKRVKSILTFGIFSPIDIQVIAPDGKRAGKDFETGEILNEIEGMYYSGYDTENEFLTIPDPLDGEYQILTQGTGDGEYKIRADKILEDEDTGEINESVAIVSGTTSAGEEDEKDMALDQENVLIEGQDRTPPEIEIKNPEENETFLNNKILKVQYNLSDNISKKTDIESSTYIDGIFQGSEKVDLSLLGLGEHSFSARAVDEAENEAEAALNFSTSANIDSIYLNVKHFTNLNLIRTWSAFDLVSGKIKSIRNLFEEKKKTENKKLSEAAKNASLEKIKSKINSQIDLLVSQIQTRKDLQKAIDSRIKELLVESLESIKQ